MLPYFSREFYGLLKIGHSSIRLISFLNGVQDSLNRKLSIKNMRKPLISIVTPCYNEELNVREQFASTSKAIARFRDKYDFEFIFTDNCSEDGTFRTLQEMAESNPAIRILRFSRNIGANRAIFQGLIHSAGDAAILIQADLQDPPELIPQFIENWERGYDVVYGKITNRNEGFFLKRCREVYYKIIANFADVATPENAGEFRLTSRRVLDALKQYNEDDIYLRGVIAHIGFKQLPIPYERNARVRGKTSTNIPFLFGYALNGLVSTSVVPLRIVILMGMLSVALSFGFGLATVIYKILRPEYIPHGITTLALLIIFVGGMQTVCLGIIAEYIRKIFVQSLRRPPAFIQDKVNFK